jgi:hypothetical protein
MPVTVSIEFTVVNMALSNEVTEKWLLVDGEWWFIYRG